MNAAEILSAAEPKRALFIGETIIDVYHYGRAQGRPMKESIPCIAHTHTEQWQGGIFASANHARTFCSEVNIASWAMLRKERYVEGAYLRKLFEFYTAAEVMRTQPALPLEQYDVVIVNDYGHGMFTPAVIERICEGARFLAVNVQTNSGNYGFNLATKWPRADFLCCDELEARLASQNQAGPIEDSLQMLAMTGERVVITLGKQGCIGMDAKGTYREAAFPGDVIDTMGAGDALFVIASLVVADVPLADAMYLGNAAGKLQAQVVGHREPVTKSRLLAYVNPTA